MYGPGDSVIFSKGLFDDGGATSPADVLPTAVVLRNGVTDNAVTVTAVYANPLYRFSFTIPSGYAVNDLVELLVSATVGSINAIDVLWRQRLTTDSAVLGEIVDTLGTPAGASLAADIDNVLDYIRGPGTIPINENSGVGGTDSLRYTDSQGNPVSGADIFIYESVDWPGNPTNYQGHSMTKTDGRWLKPLFVFSGIRYIAIFTKQGVDGPDASAPFTV